MKDCFLLPTINEKKKKKKLKQERDRDRESQNKFQFKALLQSNFVEKQRNNKNPGNKKVSNHQGLFPT